MSSEKQFIKVSITDGEQVRQHLHAIGLLDGDYKIISEDGMLLSSDLLLERSKSKSDESRC